MCKTCKKTGKRGAKANAIYILTPHLSFSIQIMKAIVIIASAAVLLASCGMKPTTPATNSGATATGTEVATSTATTATEATLPTVTVETSTATTVETSTATTMEVVATGTTESGAAVETATGAAM